MKNTIETPTLTSASFEELTREFLVRLGEDPDREGLLRTPGALRQGVSVSDQGVQRRSRSRCCSGALFTVDYDEMVIVKDIEMFSLCEHHMLPFFGKVHIAYIPKGKVIGFSKLPRLVEVFARRLQVQERLTVQIAETIEQAIQPHGRGRGHRGAPPLHDDARGREAALGDGDLVDAGSLPRAADAAGIPLAHPSQEQQRVLNMAAKRAQSKKKKVGASISSRAAEARVSFPAASAAAAGRQDRCHYRRQPRYWAGHRRGAIA